jgi:hypothetical protein
MAEIPIQPKKNRSIVPLIIGLIIIVALIWYFMSRRNNDTTVPAATDSTRTSSATLTAPQFAVHYLKSADRSDDVTQG